MSGDEFKVTAAELREFLAARGEPVPLAEVAERFEVTLGHVAEHVAKRWLWQAAGVRVHRGRTGPPRALSAFAGTDPRCDIGPRLLAELAEARAEVARLRAMLAAAGIADAAVPPGAAS